jgi:hypothetical protein
MEKGLLNIAGNNLSLSLSFALFTFLRLFATFIYVLPSILP